MNQEQEHFSKTIKTLRLKNNLTQKEFADKLGVTYQAVSKWENGKNMPDIIILKEISKILNINIDELLTGQKPKQKKNKLPYIIISLAIIVIIIAIMLITNAINTNNNFEFKTIKSNCEEFTLTGSAAYNQDKTSIYISNVDYCGGEKDITYQNFTCTLYEEYKDNLTEVGTCGNTNSPMTLNNFLDTIKINVNNYTASCKMFTNSSLFLEIIAQDNDHKTITYKIPLILDENC